MRKNFHDIIKRIERTLKSVRYTNMLNRAENNWLGLSIDEVTANVLDRFKFLESVGV